MSQMVNGMFGLMNWLLYATVLYVSGRYYLHMLQLESYKTEEYLKWLGKRYWAQQRPAWLSAASVLLLSLLFPLGTGLLALLGLALVGGWEWRRQRGRSAKKPLVYTARAKRVGAALILLQLIFYGLFYTLSWTAAVLVLVPLIPLTLALSNLLMLPVERQVQLYYMRMAQRKLAGMPDLRIVGVTGSYGKTSTKYMLRTLLAERYHTLMTPGSYNTPMGVCKVINQDLKPEHEVFVVEMGARYSGDIQELSQLVQPQIGVLTAVAPVHIETFKSLEGVAKTKYELIESLPADGLAVFNADNAVCRELAQLTEIPVIRYGLESTDVELDVWASAIEVFERGTRFHLHVGDGEPLPCRTALLGKHNVNNILAAVAVARALGLTPEEIQQGIGKMEPVPHRLQLIDSGNGVLVIDDAFNSNPDGARQALEVLRQFPGRKVVVTPGMVELGAMEYNENKKFGEWIAQICDYAILVGRRQTEPIQAGLREQGMSEERWVIVGNLQEATEKLGQYVRAGDVVLFENDLPDNYDE